LFDTAVVCLLWGDGGGVHWLVRMEWRPAGWSICLPWLLSPCTVKSRSSLLALAHPDGPGKKGPIRLCVSWGRNPPPQQGGTAPLQLSPNFYCAQTAECITMPLGMGTLYSIG